MEMKCTSFGPSRLVVAATLLMSVHLGVQPAMAHKPGPGATYDFQIMLNGSWSYLQDPNPANDPNTGADTQYRIVLVAPSHPSHGAYIFPGPNADTSNPSGNISPGLYYLDIPSRTFAGTMPPSAPHPQAYIVDQTVSSTKIRQVIYTYNPKLPRFAISVPRPDYYTTFISSSRILGTAESKIDTGNVGSVTQAVDYTVWMVLHYQVTTPISSLNEAVLKDNSPPKPNLPLQASANAVSIVNRAADSLNQKDCDTYSIYSFDHMMDLWGLPLNARFPEETVGTVGGQIHGYYHYECPLQAEEQGFAAKQRAFEKAVRCSRVTLNQINSVRKAFGLISKDTMPEQAGGGEKGCEDVEKSPVDSIKGAINDLSLGIPSKGTRKDMACLQELTNKDSMLKDCYTDLARKDLAEYVLENFQNIVTLLAMGSTDCHAAQMTVDMTIPGNVSTNDASPRK